PEATPAYPEATSMKFVLPLLVALLVGCSPNAAPQSGGEAAPARTSLKTLNIALGEEPVTLVLYGRPSPASEGGTTTARYERFFEYHAQLTMFGPDTNPIPWAATKVPTVEDGDWKLNS